MVTGQHWSIIMKRDREAELLFRGTRIKVAIERYAADYEVQKATRSQRYPLKLEDLTKKPRRYLPVVYLDPITREKFELIKITKPENDLSISCDSKQLEIVFSNILINAVEAMENSGEIKVRIKEKENEVKIQIEDSGPGIPEDKIEQMFDPLFTTKSTGTGLGLVSCKNIIERHKGSISVKNNPTIFEIILPKKVSSP